MKPSFFERGADGELGPHTNLWAKGLVYTAPSHSGEKNWRVYFGLKRGVEPGQSVLGFKEVYRRVADFADYRVSQLKCAETGAAPDSLILCQGWRELGNTMIAAFITLGLRCSDESGHKMRGGSAPTEEALNSEGGAALEELTRLAPRRGDEIYSEFDFTGSSTPSAEIVTVSYGESLSGCDAIDFEPFVERAERVACSYHEFLRTVSEVSSQPFRIRRREWFLASEKFVTIHVVFER